MTLNTKQSETGRDFKPAALALCAAILVLLVVAGFWRAKFGVDISEEGLYLSSAFRYVMGDLPYRDEIMSSARSYDIITSLVMKLLPDAGTILSIRYIALCFDILCIGFLFFCLWRRVPPLVLTAGFACSVYANVFGFWTPGYNTLARDFMCLTLGLWLTGRNTRNLTVSATLGFVAGLTLFGAITAYLSMAAAAVVPAMSVALLLFRKKIRSPEFVSAAFLSLSIGAITAAGLIYLAHTGLLRDLVYGITSIKSAPNYNVSIFWKLGKLLYQFMFLLPGGIIQGIIWLLALKEYGRTDGSNFLHRLSLLAAVILLFGLTAVMPISKIIQGAAMSTTAIYIISLRGAIPGGCRNSADASIVLPFGLVWLLVVALSSTGGFGYSATYSCPAFFLLICLAAAGGNRDDNDAETAAFPGRTITVAAVLFLFSAIIIPKSFWSSYKDADLPNLDTEFTYGRAAGVYSSETRVRNMENLLKFMDGKVDRGDRLLVFDFAALLYYLTDTLPAADSVFISKDWPVQTRKKFIADMVDKNRVPEYSIRLLRSPVHLDDPAPEKQLPYSTDPDVDPFFAFVSDNYRLVKTFGPYEVWKLRPDSPFAGIAD